MSEPPWTVALICGASGVGKTTVAAALATRYVPLAWADDLVPTVTALIVAGYLNREPEAGPQQVRASVSVLLGQRLVERAGRVGVPAVRTRPWADIVDRVDAALRFG